MQNFHTTKLSLVNQYALLWVTAFSSCLMQAQAWENVIDDYKMKIVSFPELIVKQHRSFQAQQAPTITDVRVKNIMIKESGEAVTDIAARENRRITMLPKPKGGLSPCCSSPFACASLVRNRLYEKLEKMVVYLDELAPIFGYRPGTIAIRIFEGLREVGVQRKIFDDKVAEIRKKQPRLTQDEAETEAAKWVSPVKNNVPVHATGGAVDIQLWNEQTRAFLDCGKFGVVWGKNEQAPTFSELITDQQKKNRLYLLLAAACSGLVNYVYEWWHFSCGDRYAAYWLETDPTRRVATYGLVEL